MTLSSRPTGPDKPRADQPKLRNPIRLLIRRGKSPDRQPWTALRCHGNFPANRRFILFLILFFDKLNMRVKANDFTFLSSQFTLRCRCCFSLTKPRARWHSTFSRGMARAWLINSRGIAKKVKNAALCSNYQIRDLGIEANRECPNCKYVIDNSDVSLDWPGLPAGVKFDPTDVELLEHLAGKVGVGMSKAHIFIDEFIPTLDRDQGICYTHPENLPGVKKDGSSAHFFHRTSNAYATGCKKRRKIYSEHIESEERVRWHKTGKTKPVVECGVRKGWKKIMVLYKSLGKGSKPDKANWVMHQYHLGTDEEEKDGELVVSKIFYQQHTKHVDRGEGETLPNEFDSSNIKSSPRTPKTIAPQPKRSKMNSLRGTHKHDHFPLPVQEEHPPSPLSIVGLKDEHFCSARWASESQTIQEPEAEKIDESLLCHEVLFPFTSIGGSSLQQVDYPYIADGKLIRDANTDDGFPGLDDIDIDTQSDFHLSDLQFGSQDSIMSWLDRF